MSNNICWANGDLPPPSMRQNYTHGFVQRFLPSSQFSSRNYQSDEKDNILKQRLTNLNINKNEDEMETLASLEERAKILKMHNGNQDTPSVSDIEERLAKLDDVRVEDIRYPRFAIVNETEEETVQQLMRRVKDEAALERKWDAFGKLEEHDVDPEEFIKICRSDASLPDDLNEKLSTSNANIIMGRDTVRNLKQLQRTMKLAKQQSIEAAKLIDTDSNNRSMDNEIKQLMTLTNRSSKKTAKINEELSKFWENRLNHEMSSSESSLDDIEIDHKEVERIILEAEKTENEAMKMIKESKRSGKKSGIFSRIFRSQ